MADITTPTLDIVQRTLLANQHRILAHLEPENADHHKSMMEILESGWTGEYNHVLFTSKEFPHELCVETWQILSMFQGIRTALSALPEERAKAYRDKGLEFYGFDANNNPHYFYVRFVQKNFSEWMDFEPCPNSHTEMSLRTYRTLRRTYDRIIHEERRVLGLTELDELLAALGQSVNEPA